MVQNLELSRYMRGSRDGLHLKTVHKLYNNNTYDNILGAHFTLEWCSVQLLVHAIFDAYGFFRPYSVNCSGVWGVA